MTLLPEEAMEAATMYALGCGAATYADIAKSLGVSASTVCLWIRRVDPTLPQRVAAQRVNLVRRSPPYRESSTCTICGDSGFKGEVGLAHHRRKHTYEERSADGEWD